MMLKTTSGLDRIMLLMLFETGMKVEDLVSIRISDLDLNRGLLNLASGQKLSLSQQAQLELKSYLKDRPRHGYLFEGRCGKPITGKWKRCVLERIFSEIKIKERI